jgi:hypothetical protein
VKDWLVGSWYQGRNKTSGVYTDSISSAAPAGIQVVEAVDSDLVAAANTMTAFDSDLVAAAMDSDLMAAVASELR